MWSLQNLISLPQDLTISLLEIYPKDRKTHVYRRLVLECSEPQEGIYLPEELLVMNWAQIYNQESSSHCWQRPLMCTALQGKDTDWAAKAPTLLLNAQPNTYIGVPGIVFWPMGLDLRHPIGAVKLFLICIFINQSEWLHKGQSGCTILTNQDSAMWPNQTANLVSSFA